MHRRQHRLPFRLDDLSAALGHAELLAEQSLSRRSPQTNDHLGLNRSDLSIEPGPACRDLHRIRFFMDATLAAWLPLKMLDRVADVNQAAIDAGFIKSFVEHRSGWTDERAAFQIFFVTRLLAHEHYLCVRATFAKHRLRAAQPWRTRLARLRGFAKGDDVARVWHRRRAGLLGFGYADLLRHVAMRDAQRRREVGFSFEKPSHTHMGALRKYLPSE